MSGAGQDDLKPAPEHPKPGTQQVGTQLSTNERDLIVGGQAVIEGVMMRTPNAYAVAVRKADGTITNISARLPKWSDKYPLLKLPVLRGGAVLIQSMGLGIKGTQLFCE